MPLNTSPGLVLKGKWTLVKFIASGACAEVWEVSCTQQTAAQEGGFSSWVAKIVAEPPTVSAAEKKKKRKKATDEEFFARMLSWEHSLYNGLLKGHSSVSRTPVRDNYGTEHGLSFLVMQRLGSTLSDAFVEAGRNWSNSTLGSYAKQMLQSLRECHDRKLLFIDVKPENFMLGLENPSKVFIADFGVADKYIDSKGGHKVQAGGGAGGGTPVYKSVRVHSGATPGRRDDLEALAFVLAEFVRGKPLPWETATSDEECLRLKSGTSMAALCEGSSTGGALVVKFWQLAHDTPFESEPDYGSFFKLLNDLEATPDGVADGARSSSSKTAGEARKKKGKAAEKAITASKVASAAEEEEVSSSSSSSSKRVAPIRQQGKRRGGGAQQEPPPREEVVVSDDDDDVEVVAAPPALKKKRSPVAASGGGGTGRGAGKAAVSKKTTEKAAAETVPGKKVKKMPRTSSRAAAAVEDEDEGDDGAVSSYEENEDGGLIQPNATASASASASATVSYTYTVRKSSKRGGGEAKKGVKRGALRDFASRGNNDAGDDDDEEDDCGEMVTHTATVTVNATATASHPIPELLPSP